LLKKVEKIDCIIFFEKPRRPALRSRTCEKYI